MFPPPVWDVEGGREASSGAGLLFARANDVATQNDRLACHFSVKDVDQTLLLSPIYIFVIFLFPSLGRSIDPGPDVGVCLQN